MTALSTGRCNTGEQFTRGSFNAQDLPPALIQAQRYFVEIEWRVRKQIRFLRKVIVSVVRSCFHWCPAARGSADRRSGSSPSWRP